MGNKITKNLTFMRHGNIFEKGHSYEKMKYPEFMDNLTGKINEQLQELPDSTGESFFYKILSWFGLGEQLTPLEKELKQYQIESKSLPQKVDIIYTSKSIRTRHTAKLIQKYYANKPNVNKPKIIDTQKMNLAEVKFSENLLSEEEFNERGGFKGCRSVILERWFDGTNKENIIDSLNRLKRLLNYVLKTPDENILFITHAWYMRIVYMYLNGKPFELENLLQAPIPKYGQMYEYTLQLNGESRVVNTLSELEPITLDLEVGKN